MPVQPIMGARPSIHEMGEHNVDLLYFKQNNKATDNMNKFEQAQGLDQPDGPSNMPTSRTLGTMGSKEIISKDGGTVSKTTHNIQSNPRQ